MLKKWCDACVNTVQMSNVEKVKWSMCKHYSKWVMLRKWYDACVNTVQMSNVEKVMCK